MTVKSEYDIELFNQFESEIHSGSINCHENTSQVFNEMKKIYPIGFSGIDWSNCSTINSVVLEKESTKRQKLIDDFLGKIIIEFPELSNKSVMVVGDSLTEFCYEMNFLFFVEINKAFFDIPQHTYVWFEIDKKCINLTFEDELFFG